MPAILSAVIASRLEKAAVDNGFDREVAATGAWLGFASTQCSLRIWVGQTLNGEFVSAFSKQNVAAALEDFGAAFHEVLPLGSVGARVVADVPKLHSLLRRAFQLGKSLPDELLHIFNAETAALPRTTEAERLVIQRVGQNIFRQGLLEYWEGRCAITGLAVPQLLRASHIKPWSACTDPERLDVFNGLLLAPHLDAAFDQGFITINDGGKVILSGALDQTATKILHLTDVTNISVPIANHRTYLAWHRERVFKR